MSIAEPQFRVGQSVRISPEITNAGWETGMIANVQEIKEDGRTRFEYEITSPEKTYTHCRQEHIESRFIISSVL